MLHQQGDLDGVEATLLQARNTAAEQRTALFELRAALDLARLLAATGRSGQAHAALAPVYVRLQDKGDAMDLAAAKQMLNALART
jgi:predicted ATPase